MCEYCNIKYVALKQKGIYVKLNDGKKYSDIDENLKIREIIA